MCLHKGLLGDVGSVVGRTTDNSGQTQCGRLKPADERAEGSVVTGAGAGDEITVRGLCSFGGHGRRVPSLDTSGVREVPHATIGDTMRRALIVIAVMLLAACRVDTTVDISMGADGTGTVTVTAIADADVVSQAPGLAQDLRFDDAKSAGWTVTDPTDTADGGLQVQLTHTFANPEEATALLQSINGSGGPLHGAALTRVVDDGGTTVLLTGSLRIDGLAAFADPDVLAAIGATPYAEQVAAANLSPNGAVGVTVRATLPGKITSATGTVKDGSVSWIVPLDGSQLDLTTTTVDDHGTAKIWGIAAKVALIALVAWSVVAAAFIAWVVRQRTRRAHHRGPRAV